MIGKRSEENLYFLHRHGVKMFCFRGLVAFWVRGERVFIALGGRCKKLGGRFLIV